MALTASVTAGLPAAAVAQDPKNPDWPCQQILVPTLSSASVWDGPSIDGLGDEWQRDPAVATLVRRAADDSIDPATLEPQAEALAGPDKQGAERDRKLALVFAGAFQTLDRQRTAAIASIERYAQHQRALRDRIAAALRDLDAASGDAARAKEIKDAIAWDRRILDDRRRSQTAVCEQPARIEQRLGQIARMLSALLS
ncbi:hypothetical protein J2848_005147 [Azospirillum lipoferum]|uniref:hypothetical protein n=1 Tax=Azospirillum TaxID=191 RepID=UPI001FE84F4F|nr:MULTISPECIES: hypothetical protein [Azospirillum]MCP1613451.1 hypothetical protein [Azospirillum lipoferum]MDW5533114.1 hypothetical protein [Azospirillum sp. NL1]